MLSGTAHASENNVVIFWPLPLLFPVVCLPCWPLSSTTTSWTSRVYPCRSRIRSKKGEKLGVCTRPHRTAGENAPHFDSRADHNISQLDRSLSRQGREQRARSPARSPARSHHAGVHADPVVVREVGVLVEEMSLHLRSLLLLFSPRLETTAGKRTRQREQKRKRHKKTAQRPTNHGATG